MVRKIILSHNRALGDVVTMTALVRDIALCYPGQFQIGVSTTSKEVWLHNPYIVSLNANDKDVEKYDLSYGEHIAKAGRECLHFVTAWHDDFRKKTGVHVPVLLPKPDLHLSGWEKSTRPVEERYWVVVAGGKSDFTTKHWSYARHQQVVDALRKCGITVVQAGALSVGAKKSTLQHHHPRLQNVIDFLGKTSVRDFFRLIYHAEGVICTITAAMHIAAAFDKPCVVIAGGREEWWWEGYTNAADNFGPVASRKVAVPHRFLHTIGLLNCCRHKGCWKTKVCKEERGAGNSYCRHPVQAENGQVIPLCMDLISVEHVVEAVMSYYRNGILPPIGLPPKIILPGGEIVESIPQSGNFTAEQLTVAGRPLFVAEKKENKYAVRHEDGGWSILDNEIIGGMFTICVLMYGDYHQLHRKCIDSILRTCPQERIDLRVATNAVCPETRDYIYSLGQEGLVHLHYYHEHNALKYPAMREMFWDPERPINTKWVIWFDDDTICKDDDWMKKMAQQIVSFYPQGYHMFGAYYIYRLTDNQPEWLRQGKWFRGKPFRDKSGKPTEDEKDAYAHFCTGSFWALSLEAIRACDIPDSRLGHNGGDWTIGEQLYQNGFKIKNWNADKSLVEWSSVPRRGVSEKHPGKL